jgi:hypothetical protein
MFAMLIPLMIMSGWHQADDRIDDRRGQEPIVPTFVKPEPPQIPLLIPKPVKTIRIQIK